MTATWWVAGKKLCIVGIQHTDFMIETQSMFAVMPTMLVLIHGRKKVVFTKLARFDEVLNRRQAVVTNEYTASGLFYVSDSDV